MGTKFQSLSLKSTINWSVGFFFLCHILTDLLSYFHCHLLSSDICLFFLKRVVENDDELKYSDIRLGLTLSS